MDRTYIYIANETLFRIQMKTWEGSQECNQRQIRAHPLCGNPGGVLGSLSLPGLLITIVIIVTTIIIIIIVIMGYNISTNSNHKNNKNKNDLQARAFSIPLVPSSMPGRNHGVTYWAPHPGGTAEERVASGCCNTQTNRRTAV